MSRTHTSPQSPAGGVGTRLTVVDDGRTHRPAKVGLRDSWPVHRRQAIELVGGWVVLTLVWIGLGKLITGPLKGSAIVRTDQHVATWMVAHRTPTWNHLTVIGSYLAETITKVLVTAVLALVLLRVWKRWFEPMVLTVSLVIEAAAFIVVTTIVGRHRPDVPRLDGSPVGSSFPSGHTAAAAAYVAITVVVFWHTRNRWARWIVAVVTALVPVIVALSRMYRGMHYLSDTVAGAILGLGSVVLTVVVLGRSPEGARIVRNHPVEGRSAIDGERPAAPRVVQS
jgi:membrane-associated phospholipid phosphatase